MRSWLGIVSLLVLAACQAASPTPTAPATPRPAVTDGMVDVGGLSLHIHCVGTGAPIVVLDAGLGNDGSAWKDVQPEVGRFTRACAYDRAGMGYSSGPAPSPHTNRQMARDLHALLGRAALSGPYVLVGHSLGGVNIRLFASEHLEEVAGMVLIDAMTSEQPSRYWGLVTDAELSDFKASLTKLHEGVDFDTLVGGMAEMRASSRSIGDRPLVVLTRGIEDALPGHSPEHTARMLRTWQEMQVDLSHLSTNSVQVLAKNSHHFIQWDAPELVVASVREGCRGFTRAPSVEREPADIDRAARTIDGAPLMAPSPRRNPFAPLEKEDAATFVLRMQSTTLKNWPAEVLVEWLHRHANYPGGDVYRFLDYRSFRFDRETWPLDRVPGGEAFDNPSRATFSSNLRERAKTSYDWLARYMWEHGTWNTPIILLRNEPAGLTFPRGPALRAPLHLLEGHKRLSYLINLRAEGLARSDHDVWLVSLPSGARELESGTYFDAK